MDEEKEEVKELRENLPFSLRVEVGSELGRGQGECDDVNEIFIGSEIEPVEIGRTDTPYEGNGQNETKIYHLIVQDGRPILIEKMIEERTYGHQMQNATYSYRAYEFPLKEVELREIPVSN